MTVMDPISIGLLLGGTALSGIGALGENAAKNKFLSANLNADMQQLLQDQQAAALRNQELQKYITNANAFGAQNQAALGRGIAAFSPNRLGADTAARGQRSGKRSARDLIRTSQCAKACLILSAPSSTSSSVMRSPGPLGKAGDLQQSAAMAIRSAGSTAT